MSNITSTNDLWGRTWRFNSVIDSAPGTINVNLKVFPYGSTYGMQQYVEWYYDGNKGFKGVVNANNGKVIDTWYGNTVEIQYGGSTRVAYTNGQWTSDYGTSPRVIKFVEKPEGVSFIDHDDFITWWNANTVEYSLPVQYKGLFDDIADEIRAKDGTTAEINPLLFPSKIRAITGGTPASGTIEIRSNGVHDVTEYASADVNVPIPEGYIIPEGTITITESGNYNVTNYASAEVTIEGGGGVTVPTVSNISLNAEGVVSWDAPDFTDLAEYDPVITYLVSANGSTAIETAATSCDMFSALVEGSNTISVITKAMVRQDSESTESTIVYSKPDPVVLSWGNVLPDSRKYGRAAAVGDNVYYFGGQASNSSYSNTIYKINSKDKTITTVTATLPKANSEMGVAAVGTNVYMFGGSNSTTAIVQFDAASETATTLKTVLPSGMSSVGFTCAVGTDIYVGNASTIYKFDTINETISTFKSGLSLGSSGTGQAVGTNIYYFSGSTDLKIYKIDTVSATVTTLSTKLPSRRYNTATTVIGTNIYLFGGNVGGYASNIITKFDTTTETLENLTIKMTNSDDRNAATSIGATAYVIGGNSYGKNVTQISYL